MNKIFHNNSYKLLAFTLAETLIVIGVIGIVSALTLPNLNSSTGDKEKVAKVQKIYQNLQDALGRAEAVYGPYDEWIKSTDTTNALKAKRIGDRITEFIKVSKNCGYSMSADNCHKEMILPLNETQMALANYGYSVITADGTSVTINNALGHIMVDIDGLTKGSSTLGKDVFIFNIVDKVGILPKGYDANFTNLVRNCYTPGEFTATWIINYNNADYLQFTNNTGTCKNGNTVTEANPTCK